MRKQIAFIRPGSWPLANIKMAETIREQFADCDIDIVDIKELILKNWWILGVNIILTGLLFGQDILARKKKIKEAFWHTPYIFKAVKWLLIKHLSHKKYWFTFQMQSMFDCSLLNTPHFVYTDHTHLVNLSYPGFEVSSLYKKWLRLEQQIYENTAINFVRSTNIRQSLIEQYHQSPERVTCVYAGSSVEVDRTAVEGKSYANQNILFVGMDWERKGGPELVEAFKLVLEKLPSASLIIVGSSPEIQMPNCQVIGLLDPPELIPYYKSASVFCMPTKWDPFPIVFMEAMRAGLPIVTTNIGAVSDFIQNDWNGILVEPGDVQGIANGLMKMLTNVDLCQLFGERNFRFTEERYSRQAVGQKIHKHITEYLTKEIYTL